VLSPVANYDSPSCRDGTGPWIFLKEGLCTIIAGTGSGPEGSRPTAGNYRLQVYGEENASGLTGMQARWQPSACLPFNSDQTEMQFDLHPATLKPNYHVPYFFDYKAKVLIDINDN
jgi:hypothetical protein